MGDLINGRTPEEIKAAVLCTERGTIPDCENCPYCGVVDEQGFRSFACYQAEFDLIAYVERLEAKRPKWISVKERLPEDGELVLITMNGEIDGYKQFDHAYELAFYWSEGEDEDGEYHVAGWALWDYGEGRVSDIEVFYWMPLPETPEEEANETTD